MNNDLLGENLSKLLDDDNDDTQHPVALGGCALWTCIFAAAALGAVIGFVILGVSK